MERSDTDHQDGGSRLTRNDSREIHWLKFVYGSRRHPQAPAGTAGTHRHPQAPVGKRRHLQAPAGTRKHTSVYSALYNAK